MLRSEAYNSYIFHLNDVYEGVLYHKCMSLYYVVIVIKIKSVLQYYTVRYINEPLFCLKYS